MTGRPLDDDERLLLAAVGLDDAPLGSLAERTGREPGSVATVFHRLVGDGLLATPDDATVRLTERGRRALLGTPPPTATAPDLPPVAEEVGRQLRYVGLALAGRARARASDREAGRRAVLASDADRDGALRLLADAFSLGRLSSAELEVRTGRVLGARTHGELDAALTGLGGYRVAAPHRPWRKAVFGVVAFFASPIVLLGSLLLGFGSDGGDHVGGAVVLVVMLPGLLALWRWAWPRA